MISLQYWTELDCIFLQIPLYLKKEPLFPPLKKLCTVHCVLCSVCIYVSKLVCITSVIKLLFLYHYSEIAFHTQCNLWIDPASESFQGCCSSLITTFNIQYCALCYVRLVQMEQCLLRWKSRMQYLIHLNVIASLEYFFLWYRNNSSPALITALTFRAYWNQSVSITGLALQLLPKEKCHWCPEEFSFLQELWFGLKSAT